MAERVRGWIARLEQSDPNPAVASAHQVVRIAWQIVEQHLGPR